MLSEVSSHTESTVGGHAQGDDAHQNEHILASHARTIPRLSECSLIRMKGSGKTYPIEKFAVALLLWPRSVQVTAPFPPLPFDSMCHDQPTFTLPPTDRSFSTIRYLLAHQSTDRYPLGHRRFWWKNNDRGDASTPMCGRVQSIPAEHQIRSE